MDTLTTSVNACNSAAQTTTATAVSTAAIQLLLRVENFVAVGHVKLISQWQHVNNDANAINPHRPRVFWPRSGGASDACSTKNAFIVHILVVTRDETRHH